MYKGARRLARPIIASPLHSSQGTWEGVGISVIWGGVWQDVPTSVGGEGVKWPSYSLMDPLSQRRSAEGRGGGREGTGKQVDVTIPSGRRVSEYSEVGPGMTACV